MNLLAYGINSQILEGYNPFAFSEGVNERTRENRFEHLEFCIKMMGKFLSCIFILTLSNEETCASRYR